LLKARPPVAVVKDLVEDQGNSSAAALKLLLAHTTSPGGMVWTTPAAHLSFFSAPNTDTVAERERERGSEMQREEWQRENA